MAADLLIVGAGLAGVSAALWARSLGLEPVILEGHRQVGGQLQRVHFSPPNLAGAKEGEGPALADRLRAQLAAAQIETRYETGVSGLDTEGPAVLTAGGERIVAPALLVASGVRRRQLGVPGERELEGRGVSYSATQDRAFFEGQKIVVVGGGDAAFENALLLAEVGCQVAVVVRGAPRSRPEFRRRVAANPLIEVLEQTRVVSIEGERAVSSVGLAGPHGSRTLEVAGVVVKIGMVPNTEWCGSAVERDAEGYIRVDATLRTSHPRIWAAGDVTRPPVFAMAVAVGQGALAAGSIRGVLRGDDP